MSDAAQSYTRIALLLMLTACNIRERLSTVGEAPQLSQIQNPLHTPGYQPVDMPMPEPAPPAQTRPNSLWECGARAFFKDQRAGKIGDILTVKVNISQSESIQMKPTLNSTSGTATSLNTLFGLQKPLADILSRAQKDEKGNLNPNLMSTQSSPKHNATAKYDVTDKLDFKIAAHVIQILPNGNMVIHGRQEFRLVNEVREIEIRGIVRREDISANNTVYDDKIAELRIIYSGRGDLSDLQQMPWGQQVAQKVMPF